MKKISKLIATLFFIGYCPFAPGTAASAAAVLVYVLVRQNAPLYLFITASSLALGFWSVPRALKGFSRKDPSAIVIDEFSSMLAVYLFIPFSVKFLIAGFLLFRFFDIVKIPPIKRLERLPGASGIMLDDIACALFTNLILQVVKFWPCPV